MKEILTASRAEYKATEAEVLEKAVTYSRIIALDSSAAITGSLVRYYSNELALLSLILSAMVLSSLSLNRSLAQTQVTFLEKERASQD